MQSPCEDRSTISIMAADGVRLALHCLPADSANTPIAEVVLTHGTFSNANTCFGLAGYLASIGFRCWVLDWRGHGESGAAPRQTTFDSVARLDVHAALHAVLERAGPGPVFWIGHSGGGLIGAMWAARNADLAHSRLRGFIMLGVQASLAGARLRNRLMIQFIDLLMSVTRSAPEFASFSMQPCNRIHPRRKISPLCSSGTTGASDKGFRVRVPFQNNVPVLNGLQT